MPTGDSLPVSRIKLFQIMRAEVTMRPAMEPEIWDRDSDLGERMTHLAARLAGRES